MRQLGTLRGRDKSGGGVNSGAVTKAPGAVPQATGTVPQTTRVVPQATGVVPHPLCPFIATA